MNQSFYSKPDRQVQNEYILKYTTCETPRRSRPRTDVQEKNVTIKYFMNKRRDGVVQRVQVCKKTFIETLGVSRDRVQNLCKQFFQSGITPVDKRGGFKNAAKFEHKRHAFKNFIESLRPIDKHYCRSKNTHRYYLSSDLSIAKLHNMYNESVLQNLHVNYEYFRTYFEQNYNIGFGTPSTDVCSFCLMHKETIKFSQDPDEKIKLQTELTVHKAKAKAFFDALRTDVEGTKILSYDCQKNLILPKLPDQSSYYLRQLYYYNFTVCEGLSTDKQTQNNTFCYIWTENDYQKGSNQIASAIYHRLCNTNLEGITTIKLVSDGCGGQNKNSIMVGMVCTWLAKDSPESVKNVTLLFPVVGHSFIPPDRVFGRIEKEIQKRENIVNPQEYVDIFSGVGTVCNLGTDVQVYDWKSAVIGVPKTSTHAAIPGTAKLPGSWHFSFQPSKQIIIQKSVNGIKVRGETGYNMNIGVAKSICKRGKSWRDTFPDVIAKGVLVKPEKIEDVKKLLKNHYGEQWERNGELVFYKQLCRGQDLLLTGENNEHSEEDDIGDIPEDEDVLGI